MSILQKYNDDPESLDKVSKALIDSISQVHKNLGPGYLEKIYEDFLCIELSDRGINFERQYPVKLTYKNKVVSTDFRLDLVVDGKILVEIKKVDEVHPIQETQIYSYLKMSGLPLGIIVNFDVQLIENGIKRYVPNHRSFGSSR